MNNWCFIIPYRDREAHLKRFLSHYGKLFPEVPIYVIEQQPNTPFNRAKLFNIGFLEAGKNYEWAAYHDVDMYVFKECAKCYSYPENPTHIATRAKQFNYKMPYKEYFGGVTLISTTHMLLINGFSNNFWSHGGEDDELRNNLIRVGLTPESRTCYFRCEDHPRHKDQELYKNNLSILKRGRDPNPKKDGLTACNYQIINREEKEGYTHIWVNL